MFSIFEKQPIFLIELITTADKFCFNKHLDYDQSPHQVTIASINHQKSI